MSPRLQAGGPPRPRTAVGGDPPWVTIFQLFFPILTASPHLLGKGLLFLLDEILSYPDAKYCGPEAGSETVSHRACKGPNQIHLTPKPMTFLLPQLRGQRQRRPEWPYHTLRMA